MGVGMGVGPYGGDITVFLMKELFYSSDSKEKEEAIENRSALWYDIIALKGKSEDYIYRIWQS